MARKDNPAMHPNALLELATELLHQVLQLQHPADGVV
jgi:16S rRNA (cytosine967-C5)-methyltransferase